MVFTLAHLTIYTFIIIKITRGHNEKLQYSIIHITVSLETYLVHGSSVIWLITRYICLFNSSFEAVTQC